MSYRRARSERRQFGRRSAALHAEALIPGRPRTMCLIRDISRGGALLEFKEQIVPPYRFNLRIAGKINEILCEIRHQGRHGIGVRFISGHERALELGEFGPELQAETKRAQRPAPAPSAQRCDALALRKSLVTAS